MKARLGALVTLALLAVGLLGAAAAFGYWLVNVNSSPTASAAVATLLAPASAQTTEASATSDNVSWTDPGSQIAAGTTTYKVVRSPGNVTVCNQTTPSSPAPCTDTGLTAGQTYNYTVTAELQGWSSATSATTSYTALGVTTSSLPGGTVGNTYSLTPQATGGTGTYNSWSHTGTLPLGLSFNSATGAISGNPTTAGTTSGITLTVTDSAGYQATSGPLSITIAQTNTTTTLSIAGTNPTTYGAENGITFNVTVTPVSGTGTPTGTVAVKNGSTALCTTGNVNGSGQASCSLTATQLGASSSAYSLTATYNSDGNFTTSTSSAQSLTVNPDSATVSVFQVNSSSSATTTYGAEQNLTFSATVTTGHGESIPTGDMVWVNRGGGTMCFITLTNGAGTCSPSATQFPQTGGAKSFAGNFNPSSLANPDSNFVMTAFATVTVTINPDTANVTLKINNSNPTQVTYGAESSTYAVQVNGTNGETIPSGDTVTVTQGATTICTVTSLTSGAGSCNNTNNTLFGASATAYTITATFNSSGADTNFTSTSSGTDALTVNKASQTITWTNQPSSGTFGGSATLTATGGGSGNAVVFTIDASSGSGVCSVSGTNGTSLSYTGVGTCVVDASQAGDSNYNAAPPVQDSFSVGKASQAISWSNEPSSGAFGGSATLTATGGGSGNPVVFTIDASSGSGVCSVSGPNGTSVSYTGVGTCVVDAAQAGNSNYNAAPQVQDSFSVGQAVTTLTAAGPSTASGAIPASSIGASVSGGSGATGTVTFYVFGPQTSAPTSCTSGGIVVGTATVSGNGSYQPSAGFIAGATGNYWWYASYSGDSKNGSSVSPCGSSMNKTVVSGTPSNATSAGTYTLQVPAGKLIVTFTLKGAGGGGSQNAAGGSGASQTGTITLTSNPNGTALSVIVGGGGGSSASRTAGSGYGSNAGTGNSNGSPSAGGGGASAIQTSGSVLVVSAGGGGAGGDSNGGAGGAAGLPTTPFSSTTNTGTSGHSGGNGTGAGAGGPGGTTTAGNPPTLANGCSTSTCQNGGSGSASSGGGGGGGYAFGAGGSGTASSNKGGGGGGGGSSVFESQSGFTVAITADGAGSSGGSTTPNNGTDGSASFSFS